MKTILAPAKLRHHSRPSHRTPPRVASIPASAGFRLTGAALAIAAAFVVSPGRAEAQASGAQVIHGQASMVQQGNSLVVTTQNGAGTSHSAINWQSFSVPAGSTTQFNQPNAASTSINRVLGNDPSAIFGTLSSNGRLVLVNPSGIAVGAGAVVDTAGFTASTLRMSDADALAGRLVFGGDGLGGGPLAVEGRILARSGDVVLVAPNVQVGSNALLQSPNGATLLAAGQKVELTGRGLEGIHMEIQAPADQAVNLGTLQGDAVGIFAGQLKHSGLIQATGVSAEGGKVVLKGTDVADISGQVVATSGDRGGQVQVTANEVIVRSGALIDVSGEQGGGQAFLGGGWQGKDSRIANAQQTTVEAGAAIDASATVKGDGGTVAVWSDDTTQFAGKIAARGGEQGGNGGNAEVSGKQHLRFRGDADLGAPKGATGNLLLDPTNLVIAGGVGDGDTARPLDGNFTFDGGSGPGQILAADALATVYQSELENITAANIMLQATDSISVSGTFTANTITLKPNTSITLQQTSATSGAGIDLRVLGTTPQPIGIATSGTGSITLSAAAPNGGIALGDWVGSGPGLTASGTGNINVSALNGYVNIVNTTLQTGGGSVAISGNTSVQQAPSAGVYLDRATVDAGMGSISIIGTTQDPNSVGVHIAGPTILTAGGGTTVYGENQASSNLYSGGGILADCDCSDALTGVGSLSLTGKSSDAGYGVRFDLADIRRSGGSLAVDGSSTSGYGVNIYSSNIVMSDASNVSLKGSSPSGPAGVDLSYSAIQTAGGAVSLASTDAGVNLNQTAIDTSNGNISIAGGNTSYGSVGINIQGLSGLHAGAGAVNMVGESGAYEGFVFDMGETASSATATISGSTVNIRGSTSSGTSAALRVGGTFGSALISATSSAQLTAVDGNLAISNATIQNSGSGLTVLEAVATAPSQSAPAISIDSLSTVQNAGGTGEIHLAADSIYLDGLINSGAARTMFTPSTTSRAISLGGTDESGKLTLTEAELNNVTASVIVAGGAAYAGGLTIDGPVSLKSSGALSLIQGASGSISQGSGASVTVGQLNADAGSVSLTEANAVQVLSGRATSVSGKGFVFSNGGVADLTVGVVDGISGIVSQSSASLSGSGTLQLPNASTVGSLSWSGFTNATLGSGGGMISVGGPITADGDVALAGILAPGGVGGINTMTVAGNLQVMDGATMKFDFSGTSHDSISVGGNVIFPSGGTGSSVVADASIQPPAGSYTLISGATSGDLPSLSGSVVAATLAYGSLVLNVASPPPPPAPLPTTLSALDQIKLMVGDPSLPPFEDPVTTFLTLFTKAADEQAQDRDYASDNIVDDSQCRR